MSLSFDSARLPNPDLTEEHEAWRAQLRRFIDREIMPHVDEWDEQGLFAGRAVGQGRRNLGLLGLGFTPSNMAASKPVIDFISSQYPQ